TVIVYQAPWDWEFLWNRAQPLAQALSRHAEVLYLNGGVVGTAGVPRWISRLPGAWRWHRERISRITPSLSVWTWQALQPDPLRLIREDRPAWHYGRLCRYLRQRAAAGASIWLLNSRPLTAGLTRLFPWDRVLVDIEDPWFDLNWSRTTDRDAVLSFIRDADCAFANGARIAAEYQELAGRSVVSLPNGVDAAFIDRLGSDLPVPDFYRSSGSDRRAVFTGNINDRIDFGMLADAVQEPGWRFFFVGQDSVPAEHRATWERILARPNVCFAGSRPHGEIPAILQHADVLLMPYAHTGHEKMFPAKLFEYAAAGKPIITTVDHTAGTFAIPSVVICGSSVEYRDALRAIRGRREVMPADVSRACAALARQNTWDARAEEFMALAAERGTQGARRGMTARALRGNGATKVARCTSTT
ncbi:MAG: glycosyltransferase, partial [Planctomycetia bacterium]